jgi:tetratricopeptide (TPR) repeat protein
MATGAFVASLFVSDAATARPIARWADARDGARRATETRALAAADLQLGEGLRLRRLASGFDPLGSAGFLVHQQEARRILEAAGGARAASPEVRLRYAEVLADLRQWAEAAEVLEGVVDHLPAPRRIDAWVELAVAYARLDRGREEIQCYDRALAFEPHGSARSTILANQAEAYMAVGDVARAIAGYRAALEPLSSPEDVARRAPTTLWGLGVALDRSGELDAGLDAIQRARSYDPADRSLSGDGWFFNPAHDAAWYGGLGHLLVARRGPELDVRRAAYGRAIEAFREYVAMAPTTDLWLPAARARIVALSAEQTRFERRFAAEKRKEAKPASGPPRRPSR